MTVQTESLWFLDTLVRIRVSGDANAVGMSVIEHVAPFGSSPPLHVHRDEDEIFHILSGELRFRVDGEDIHAHAGDTLLAPKGRPHSFRVTSADGARWLTITNRSNFERMVRTASRTAEDDTLPPRSGPPSPEQAAALAAVCRENRIDLVGPPLT